MKTSLKLIVAAGAIALSALSLTALAETVPPAHHGERHPAIHAAISALEKARAELEHADHDFGGHRAAALAECDKAIAELRLALQYDKK